MAEQEKAKSKANGLKDNASDGVFTIDITPSLYQIIKETNLRRVPKLARPFVKQYFDWLAKLTPDEVFDWMEGKETLKEMYEKAPFTVKVALIPARNIIKFSKSVKAGANEAINWEVATMTLRFENPNAWAVIGAFGDEGIEKIKQGIEDIKVILKMKEEKTD
ncbi:hypothetical protein ES703_81224 [subsurface metagenome]